jgi:hypothetical protein
MDVDVIVVDVDIIVMDVDIIVVDVDVDDEIEPSIKYKYFIYLKFDIFVELL